MKSRMKNGYNVGLQLNMSLGFKLRHLVACKTTEVTVESDALAYLSLLHRSNFIFLHSYSLFFPFPRMVHCIVQTIKICAFYKKHKDLDFILVLKWWLQNCPSWELNTTVSSVHLLNSAHFMLLSVRGGTENCTVLHSEWNLGVRLCQPIHRVLPGDLGQRTEPTH